MSSVRLAIVSTHPIQYYAPIFQLLARHPELQVKVFYTWSQTQGGAVADPGFGRAVAWDIPLLEGYEFEFVPNVAERPGTGHFWGVRTPDLTRRIASWHADAVLVFGWNCASHLNAMRYFKGRIPVFFRGDSTLLDSAARWRTAARRVFLSWVYSHIDVALAVGSNNRDYFRWCGVPPERIGFAPHAVDVRRFSTDEPDLLQQVERWSCKLGLVSGTPTLVYAGKLQAKKDPLLLLEAFLQAGGPGQLVFVGEGPLEQEVRRRAGGCARVHFLPFQNQRAMPAVYRLGDVFVLPSRGPGETWGLALNEAMSCRRPVIASDRVGGARDLVVRGVNGWMFESGNLEQLAAVVSIAMGCSRATLLEMGAAAGRESARWSVEAAASGIAAGVMAFTRTGPGGAGVLSRSATDLP
jgi:glycosyltransferase involved in cell wall biosynthesis